MTAAPAGRDATGLATGRLGQRGVLIAMCTSLVLVVASVSALNLALPTLAVDLSTSNTSLTWIADGYTVALAALVLPFGALGDRLGRRNILIAGNIVFGLASVGAGSADSSTALIVWRVAMGFGAAMIMPGTLSTITAAFPANKRSQAVATWSGFAAAGAIIGMLIAGGLLEGFSWRAIFYTSAAAAVIAATLALLLAPDTKDSNPERFDAPGALFTALAIGSLVYAIVEGNERGWTVAPTIVAVAVTVVSLAAYAFLGLHSEHPLLDPHLFGIRGFRAGAVTVLVQFMAVFGFFFVGLQYLQLVLGYSALKSAVALIPVGLVVLPISQLTPKLTTRIGMKVVMVIGLLFLASGLFSMSFLEVNSGYLPFLSGLILSGIGIGLTSSVGTTAIVGSLRRDQQGVASAMNDTTREVGSAIGIALMGSVFGGHYRSALPASIASLPHEAVQAVRDSPAGGLFVAGRLGLQGRSVADAVREAFITGLSASLLVISIILAVAAIGCLLRAPNSVPNQND